MKWEAIHSVSELKATLPSLAQLISNAPNTTIFNSSVWLELWLDTFWQPHWQLTSYVIYENAKPVAFIPLYIQPAKFWLLPNTLFLLGQGESEKYSVASEYLDIIIDSQYKKDLIPLISNLLATLPFDKFGARAVLSESFLSDVLFFGNYKKINRRFTSRYIVKKQGWTIDRLSKNTLKKYQRSLKKLSENKAEFIWIPSEEFPHYLNKLIEFHQSRWQKKGENGAFFHQNFTHYHQQFIKNHGARHIRMSAILVNNQAAAINYYLTDFRTLYFYQSGWNEELFKSYSPGLTLHAWSIDNCKEEYYDFMMGARQSTYKAKFGSLKSDMESFDINVQPSKVLFEKVVNKLNITKDK